MDEVPLIKTSIWSLPVTRHTFGVSTATAAFRRHDDNWEQVPGHPLTNISAARDGTVWGVDRDGNPWALKDQKSFEPVPGEHPAGLSVVAVGTDRISGASTAKAIFSGAVLKHNIRLPEGQLMGWAGVFPVSREGGVTEPRSHPMPAQTKSAFFLPSHPRLFPPDWPPPPSSLKRSSHAVSLRTGWPISRPA